MRICDYGAGNTLLGRGRASRGSAPTSPSRATRRRSRRPTSPCCPGVGSAASAMAGLRARGLDEALRERVAAGEPTLGICLGLQLALEETEEDGGVAGLGLLPGRAVRLREGRVPRIGWASSSRAARPTTSRTPTPPRPPPRPRSRRASSPRRGSGASSASSSTPRRRRRRRPLPRSDASPAADPVPRRRGRPRRQGRQVRGAARRRRPGRARRRLLGRGRRRARLPRRQGDARGAARRSSSSCGRVAERLAIPFTVGGGVRAVDDAAALLDAGADKVSVNSAALARPGADRRAGGAPRLAGGRRRDRRRRAARSTRTPARARPAGDAVEWAREAEERGAGEILLTSIDADGTREGYDLGLTGAVADAVSVPVIASGGAGNAAPRRRGARGRPGGAARLDPPREPGAARPRSARSSPSDGGAAP